MRRQARLIEIIAPLEGQSFLIFVWHLPAPYHRADVLRKHLADNRPSFYPRDGQQTNNPSAPIARTMMRKEIPIAVFAFHNTALVRFHSFTTGQSQLLFLFVRSGQLTGTPGHDITSYSRLMLAKYQIIPLADLYQLAGFPAIAFIDKHSRLAVYAFSIFCHFKEISLITVSKMSAYKISFPVFIPHHRAIIPSGFTHQGSQRFPRSFRAYRRSHEETFIGRTEVQIKPPVVITERTCPYSTSITVHHRPIQRFTYLRQIFHNVATDFPVNQILRVQQRHARRELEGGRYGIIIISHPNAINIAIIRRNDGIHIHTVPLVTPNLPIAPSGLLPHQSGTATTETKNK